MKTYQVNVTLTTSAVVVVTAEDLDHAEELIRDQLWDHISDEEHSDPIFDPRDIEEVMED